MSADPANGSFSRRDSPFALLGQEIMEAVREEGSRLLGGVRLLIEQSPCRWRNHGLWRPLGV